MGLISSVSLLDQNIDFEYFSAILYPNKIQFILTPFHIKELTEIITIDANMKIQRVTKADGFTQFRIQEGISLLKHKRNDTQIEYFICLFLKKCFLNGWHPKLTSGLNHKGVNNILFFEKQNTLATNILCLRLSGSNKVRVFATTDIINMIRSCLKQCWSNGIESENEHYESWEFKLNGKPWSNESNQFSHIILTCDIFKSLHGLGWKFMFDMKMSKTRSMYFYYSNEPVVSQDNVKDFFAIQADKNKIIRLFGIKENLISDLTNFIKYYWMHNCEEVVLSNDVFEIRLAHKKSELYHNNEEFLNLIGGLLQYIKIHNWNYYGSCKSTMFFHWNPNIQIHKPFNFFLYFEEKDKLKIINGNEKIESVIWKGITNGWPYGIMKELKNKMFMEFTLNCHPFKLSRNYPNSIFSVFMMTLILCYLKKEKFDVIGQVFLDSKKPLSSWYLS